VVDASQKLDKEWLDDDTGQQVAALRATNAEKNGELAG